VINLSKIRWALNTFKPFKSAGTDGIVPVLLQQGVEHLVPHLCRIFRACMAYGFILTAWRQVKVAFIVMEKQLDKAINKAYKALWTSRGTFGKTWG
jgi:hypothetical protein